MADINVSWQTQKIIVDPSTNSISVIHAGPQGPAGVAGGIPEAPTDGEQYARKNGSWQVVDAVKSLDFTDIVEISQAAYDALGGGASPTTLYIITS